MVVQHNLPAMNSHRQLGINTSSTAKNLEKLSSGLKVNRAGDDAAGLAISEKMRGQIRGLDMATTNAQNGVSLLQTAEGGLNETHAVLQRMRELSVQSANGTYADDIDRENIDKEVQALKSEIDRIASSTHYNSIKLLDGSLGGKKFSEVKSTDVATEMSALGLASGTGISLSAKGVAAGLGGQEATLIVSDKGKDTMKLQIGDKTFSQSATDKTKFVDANGVTVASVSIANTGAGTSRGVVSFTTAADTSKVGVSVSTNKISKSDSKLTFQIGANGSNDQQVNLHVDNMSSANIGTSGSTKVSDISAISRTKANDAIKVLDDAINQVSGTRADLGALQNRLEHTIDNLGTTRENLQAAESTIRDVDMAKEMMDFTKNNILSQASQAMLAQSNVQPQGVLSLLR